MHGSFSRADTRNTMAAIGPDFQSHFADPAPASNADLGMTIASIMQLEISSKGKLVGRVLTEAMGANSTPAHERKTLKSKPDALGNVTQLDYQAVGNTLYFDAAGYPGRTLGLQSKAD